MKSFDIFPIGYVHSTLEERYDAPRQRWEDAPERNGSRTVKTVWLSAGATIPGKKLLAFAV